MAIFNLKYIESINESYHDYYNMAASKLETFFQHAVVWMYKPEIQHRDWVDSIIDNARNSKKDLKDNKNAYNLLKENLEEIYKSSLKRNKFLKYNKDINDNGKIYEIFNDLDTKIWNDDYIKSFLLKYAYNETAKNWIYNKR